MHKFTYALRRVGEELTSSFSQVLAVLARRTQLIGILAGVGCFAFVWLYFGIYQPPSFFPLRTVVTVPEGAGLAEVASILKDAQVVRSATAFSLLVSARDAAERVHAGDYFFDRRLNLAEVANRLIAGEYGLEPMKITVPEGATTYEMADLFALRLGRFDKVTFLALAREKEGYLFPDTYYFLPNATASQVLTTMEKNFYDRIDTVGAQIAAFNKPLHEIIIMASLLEREAFRREDKEYISGILWNRIRIDMPLQVDAVFGYIHETDTYSPKFSDLEVDSPYNTYRYKGLPPGPIANPGLDSIVAAVTPRDTDALYYLHGNDGSLHMARTFDEHVSNRRRYLR